MMKIIKTFGLVVFKVNEYSEQ